jgi:hypothetical protein
MLTICWQLAREAPGSGLTGGRYREHGPRPNEKRVTRMIL